MEKNQVELEYDHFAAPKELTDLRIKPQRSLQNKRESPPRLRLPIQGHATTCGPAKGTETVSPAPGPTSCRREGHPACVQLHQGCELRPSHTAGNFTDGRTQVFQEKNWKAEKGIEGRLEDLET